MNTDDKKGLTMEGKKMEQKQEYPQNATLKKEGFNERRVYEVGKIDNIVINLPYTNVSVYQSTSSKVEVRLVGEISIVGESVKYRVQRRNRNLVIILVVQGDVTKVNLEADIYLPDKYFNLISIFGTSSDIYVEKGIFAKNLRIRTESGKVETGITFEKAELKSADSELNVHINAESDIEVSILTDSGDININLNNIKMEEINIHSVLGSVRYHHREAEGYKAVINASSRDGNIFIG